MSALLLFSLLLSAQPGDPVLRAECLPWILEGDYQGAGEVRLAAPATICLRGETDAAAADAFRAELNEIPADRAVTIVVRSGGGDVGRALDMAEALLPRDSTVLVRSICASSCANYLFMAADRRIVSADSLLVFHGGLSPGFIRSSLARLRGEPRKTFLKNTERDVPRQESLLRAAGVDPGLFEFFDGINAAPRRQWSPHCARWPRAGSIVFSDAFLRDRGLEIDLNLGPKSADELERLITARGARGQFCYWQ